jgi:hypothetical protein
VKIYIEHRVSLLYKTEVSVVATTPNCSLRDAGLCFLLQNNKVRKTPASFAADVCKRLGLASIVIDP